jgi:hypothetical protein
MKHLSTILFCFAATLSYSQNKTTNSGTNIKRDQNNAGRDINITNKTSIDKSKINNSKTKVVDSSKIQAGFINYGTNNGVMANTVVVPEDSNIPLKDNYDISNVTDTLFTKNKRLEHKFIFELKPKQGVWYNSFVAYPLDEDSLVKGSFTPKALSYSMMGGGGTLSLPLKDGTRKSFKYFNMNKVANPYMGNILICDKPPSILLFGDFDNPSKQYIVFYGKVK